MGIKKVLRILLETYLRITDPKRVPEIRGERVVFNYLKKANFFDGLAGKRILEIGPKHGKDSVLLSTLNPAELVLIDLPSKDDLVNSWLPQVKGKKTYIQNNILYMTKDQYLKLGTFDLIWCMGVIYHNIEQVRLLKRLFDLCNVNGKIVVESSTTRNNLLKDLNVVEIHWPEPYNGTQTVTHHPSRLAIKSWLEMVGFQDVSVKNIYSRRISAGRVVYTATKTPTSKPHINYDIPDKNPPFIIGDSV